MKINLDTSGSYSFTVYAMLAFTVKLVFNVKKTHYGITYFILKRRGENLPCLHTRQNGLDSKAKCVCDAFGFIMSL